MQQTDSKTESTAVSRIEDKLRKLSPDKLATVFDFVSYLVERQGVPETFQTMLASEQVLRRDWDTPEEDAAWGDL
jgi:hypothetical protein